MGLAPFDKGGPTTVAYCLLKQFAKMPELKLTAIVFSSGTKREIQKIIGRRFENITTFLINQPLHYYIGKMWRVWNVLKHVDLVHINDFYEARTFLLPFLPKIRRKPIVYSYHGWISRDIPRLFEGERLRLIKTAVERVCYTLHKPLWSRIVVNSQFSQMIALNYEGIERRRICLIPHGFDQEGIERVRKIDLEGEIKLLYVGSLIRIKQVDLILKAISMLDPSIKKNVRLYVAGDGMYKRNLESLAIELKISKNVIFLGALPLNECYRLYKSCDIYISPSSRESFGLSLLEAMGAGMSIIAVNGGATPELVKDGRNGFLVESNAFEMAEKISVLTQNPEIRWQMSKNNIMDSKRYSWPNISQQYLKLYESIV